MDDVQRTRTNTVPSNKCEVESKSLTSSPCTIGEKVEVTTADGVKFGGEVRFIGTTKFAAGEWIGIELE